jgi:hypothetical protein
MCIHDIVMQPELKLNLTRGYVDLDAPYTVEQNGVINSIFLYSQRL